MSYLILDMGNKKVHTARKYGKQIIIANRIKSSIKFLVGGCLPYYCLGVIVLEQPLLHEVALHSFGLGYGQC